jgi:penicillin-binding protein 2
MNKRIFSRQNIMALMLILAIALLIGRLANLTIIHGEEFAEQAINNRIKKLSIVAKRGEVLDRNGDLLAGNTPGFTVQLMADGLSSESINDVSDRLIALLDKNDEKHITFPIVELDGELVYRSDLEILKWLVKNGFNYYVPADQVFKEFREREQISETLDNYEAQAFMLMKGITLPISVKTMKYLDEMYKNDFLRSYDIPIDTPAQEAFDILCGIKSYAIDEYITKEQALRILTIRYALKIRGYIAYEPIRIADSVAEETAILIQEMGMDFPGVNVEIEPIRYYPNESLAAHILGYLGKISTTTEISHYIEALGYGRNEIIGKVGIEGTYEEILNGEDGFRYIEVDAYGRYVKDVDIGANELQQVNPIAGMDVQLTIDTDLQKIAETSLNKWIQAINQGGIYEDAWGDVTYEAFEKAETGSIVVVDVNNGEVLALANAPSYDPNLFATGISTENWNLLTPENPRNPLAPRPLYNTATMTAVQPGSTFKMVTALAALRQGLDPDRKLYSDGYVEVGDNTFGCWLWNDYHAKHGPTDLYHALEVTCNYYFFNLAMGMDYRNDKPLGIEMNADILIEQARQVGLNEKTGLEIAEVVRGVPDEEKKTSAILWGLKIKLSDEFEKFFPLEIADDDERKDQIIDEILSWSTDAPSRAEIIRRLMDLGANDDYYIVEGLADIIKYDYLNRIGWFEGDVLNMAIGQGDHLYTPVQMARYIMSIANNGYLYDLTLVKRIAGLETIRALDIEPLYEDSSVFEEIRRGMYAVAQGDSGTARKYFESFPVDVGAKTGTAEKEGKIPPVDEETYLSENLELIDPSLSLDEVQRKTEEIIIDRNDELAQYEKLKDESIDENAREALTKKIDALISNGYLTVDSAMREAVKELSALDLTDTIINQYREDYDSYAWFVGFAPYENPEIAVVIFLPQGGHGGYAAPIARDIFAEYLGLKPQIEEVETDD